MKFEKIKGNSNPTSSDGVLFEAIEKYIETTKFPKNLVLRKLDLIENKVTNNNNELDKTISKGEHAIKEIMTKSNILNDNCNTLLMELKRNFTVV